MIGEHPVADVGGAHAVGLPMCWFRRGRVWLETGHRPTLAMDSCARAVATLVIRRFDNGVGLRQGPPVWPMGYHAEGRINVGRQRSTCQRTSPVIFGRTP